MRTYPTVRTFGYKFSLWTSEVYSLEGYGVDPGPLSGLIITVKFRFGRATILITSISLPAAKKTLRF